MYEVESAILREMYLLEESTLYRVEMACGALDYFRGVEKTGFFKQVYRIPLPEKKKKSLNVLASASKR